MYPASRAARDRFVLEHRGPRRPHDPWRYQNLIVEDELTGDRTVARSGTVFLTGKECAWRCVMCDLWQFTTSGDTPRGAIPAQLETARTALADQQEDVRQLKLYNASNFFDEHAVPEDDYPAIAQHLRGLDRVIVESHPSLTGSRVDRFLETLQNEAGGQSVGLEVALGLETANPDALEQLNKGLTVGQFAAAAGTLTSRGVEVRVFVLISPPFIAAAAQDQWLIDSVKYAFSCGGSVVSLIPTRSGNGAMNVLEAGGMFQPPTLDDIERSFEIALEAGRSGRVFVDLWDLQRFARCAYCEEPRRQRLLTMNLEQRVLPAVTCRHCGHGKAA